MGKRHEKASVKLTHEMERKRSKSHFSFRCFLPYQPPGPCPRPRRTPPWASDWPLCVHVPALPTRELRMSCRCGPEVGTHALSMLWAFFCKSCQLLLSCCPLRRPGSLTCTFQDSSVPEAIKVGNDWLIHCLPF